MELHCRYRNIEAKRFGTNNNPSSISNNSTMISVSDSDDSLSVNFVFSCNYEPNIGIIRIEGELNMGESKENVKRAMDEWHTSGKKSLPKDIAERVHNAILSNCIVEATILSKEIRLPAPIPTPKVSIDGSSEALSDTQSYIR